MLVRYVATPELRTRTLASTDDLLPASGERTNYEIYQMDYHMDHILWRFENAYFFFVFLNIHLLSTEASALYWTSISTTMYSLYYIFSNLMVYASTPKNIRGRSGENAHVQVESVQQVGKPTYDISKMVWGKLETQGLGA